MIEQIGGFQKSRIDSIEQQDWLLMRLSALATDATGQLHVLGHNSHTLGVDGAEVGILEQADEVGLAGFLKSHDGRSLEAKIGLEILSNLTHQTLKRRTTNEKLGGLLVLADLAKSDSAGAETGLLTGLGLIASSFGGKLLARSLGASALAGGLLGSRHVLIEFN
jgi:hypothetical protein